MSTCARCGHTTPACTRCGQNDELLGGRIREREFCHTFSASPSCYTQEQWEDTAIRAIVGEE